MARELEEPSAGKDAQLLTQVWSGLLPHHGVDFHDFSKPSLLDGLEHKLEGGIVPQHISHLHHKPLFVGGGQKSFERL